MNTRIAIVEDNDEIRGRFIEIMSEQIDIICVGSYTNAEDFISEFGFLKPDVVFMDIHLPGMNGIDCITIGKTINTKSHFIIYTIFENNEMIYNAIKAGATGYLLKSTPREKLVASIHEIIRGESPMTGSIAMKILTAFQQKIKEPESNLLSKRENEILGFLSKGYRYKEIAELLFISIETVRTHIRNIYEKLQVNSRTEALNKAENRDNLTLKRYTNSSVKIEDEENCFQKIQELFKNEKPFLQEKYSIGRLAKDIDFPVYIVSQTINRRFNQGYFDFINRHRINEVIQLLKTSSNKITIEGIAYQCGFCSRTSFYSAFKKETGENPSKFIQNQKN